MENCSNNSVNCSAVGSQDDHDARVYAALGILIPLMGGVTFALNIPTIVALCMARTINSALRCLLISTLTSGLLISGTFILLSLIALVTVFSDVPPPPLLLCRFSCWLVNTASLSRVFGVLAFTTMVMIIVRYGKNVIRPLYIVLSLIAVWTVPLFFTFRYQVPQFYGMKYISGVVCWPVVDDTVIIEGPMFFTVFVLSIGCWMPLIICIVLPLVLLCYIKKHSITKDKEYNKSITKLSLFLVTGSTGSLINATTATVLSLLVYFTSVSAVSIIYSSVVIGVISLYPTPFLIVIYLTPVREEMKKFPMFLHHHSPLQSFSVKSVKTVSTTSASE